MQHFKRLAAACVVLVSSLVLAAGASAGAGDGYTAQLFDATAKPRFTTEGGVTPFRTSKTIPYWQGQFTDPTNGITYPYTMVGTNPYGAAKTTTVPSAIVPFRFVFADGTVMDATQDVPKTIASPVFQAYSHPLSLGDYTQTVDAFYRAQWNKVGTNYHVLLAQPTVYPPQTVDVPANQGFAMVNSRGVLVGLVDRAWFSSRLKNLLGQLHVDPASVPIFLTHNTLLYEAVPTQCCFFGYHGASSSANGNGSQAVQTYIFSAYITPRTFGGFPTVGLSDIHGISHEVAEWYDDPFVNNRVTPWFAPTAPQYGCVAYLETGDPVVGYWYPLPGNPDPGAGGVWHPEDEAYFSWFAREKPSRALFGYYTYMNTFSDVAQSC